MIIKVKIKGEESSINLTSKYGHSNIVGRHNLLVIQKK